MNTSRLPRRLGGLCFALLISIGTAFGFEGKVDMTMTSGKDTMQMSYRIKDDRMRMEMPEASGKKKKKRDDGEKPGAMIMDLKKKEMIMLMPEQKMYMVHAIPEPKPQTKKKKNSDVEFQPTGRKEKIAGIEAEEYVGKSDGKITEIWLTKEMGRFMMAEQGKKDSVSSWEAFAQKDNAFPLRVIQRSKEGGPESFRMETTNVDRSKQDASLFVPPADYEKFTMPGMGDMMKGLIPGR